MSRVDPDFIDRVRSLGAADATACYSCGNCTAACPLSKGDQSFPRRMIRYALLGMKEEIVRSPELWLCYYCGECSDSCPREADPGALMSTLRRYAIARTSPAGIAWAFYHRTFSWVLWSLLTVLSVAGILLARSPQPNLAKAVPLSYLSLGFLHDFGIATGIYLFLVVAYQVISQARSYRKSPDRPALRRRRPGELFGFLLREIILQKRHEECTKRDRHVAHLAVFWGFLGLFGSTVLVFGVDFFGFPEFIRGVSKVIGLASGAALVYGSAVFLRQRIEAKDSSAKASHSTDWVFLILLLVGGLSGFVLDAFIWLNLPQPAYIAFAVHMIAVFELLVALPFSKFAHAVYRPLALWFAASPK
jgi:ferredoxin